MHAPDVNVTDCMSATVLDRILRKRARSIAANKEAAAKEEDGQ